MKQASKRVTVSGNGRGFTDLTPTIADWLDTCAVTEGLVTAFVAHTSASLVIQENADPNVLRDLEQFLARIVPDGDPSYTHRSEGPDDMPAHIRSALTQSHVAIPVVDGRMALGTWQSVYLYEHRTRPRPRHVVLHVIGT